MLQRRRDANYKSLLALLLKLSGALPSVVVSPAFVASSPEDFSVPSYSFSSPTHSFIDVVFRFLMPIDKPHESKALP
jgi:hypothetical protein